MDVPYECHTDVACVRYPCATSLRGIPVGHPTLCRHHSMNGYIVDMPLSESGRMVGRTWLFTSAATMGASRLTSLTESLPFRICALRVLVRSFGLVRGAVFVRHAVVDSRRCGGLLGFPLSIVEWTVILELHVSDYVLKTRFYHTDQRGPACTYDRPLSSGTDVGNVTVVSFNWTPW
jgi:hypothetical protein